VNPEQAEAAIMVKERAETRPDKNEN